MLQIVDILRQVAELPPHKREVFAFLLSVGVLDDSPPHREPPRTRPSAYPSITRTTGVCGGDARLIRTRIPVWVIERMTQLGFSDLDILRSYPTLGAADLVEARRYAESHRKEIEAAIRQNESDEE